MFVSGSWHRIFFGILSHGCRFMYKDQIVWVLTPHWRRFSRSVQVWFEVQSEGVWLKVADNRGPRYCCSKCKIAQGKARTHVIRADKMEVYSPRVRKCSITYLFPLLSIFSLSKKCETLSIHGWKDITFRCSVCAARQKSFSTLIDEDPSMVVWVFFLQPPLWSSVAHTHSRWSSKRCPQGLQRSNADWQLSNPNKVTCIPLHCMTPNLNMGQQGAGQPGIKCMATICHSVTWWGLSETGPFGQTHTYIGVSCLVDMSTCHLTSQWSRQRPDAAHCTNRLNIW